MDSFVQGNIQFYNRDCSHMLDSMPDGMVDLFIQDPPYGETENQWDKAPDLSVMWPKWLRVAKENAAFVFTAQQPFATELINSARDIFRYDLIWVKGTKKTGFLNAGLMPLRNHELILVFYRHKPTFNPQKTKGKPSHPKGGFKPGKKQTNNNYGSHDVNYQGDITDDKYPVSVIEFQPPHPPIHPTQKPVNLMRWLIRTYSNEGDIVFDGYSGVGTTARACIKENRKFIGCETGKGYFADASTLIKKELHSPELKFTES